MGIFNNAITGSEATGPANTDATLFSANLAGGSINDGNAFTVRLYRTGNGSAKVKLGNVLLWEAQDDGVHEVTVWRDGSGGALVEGIATISSGVYRIAPATKTGLNWSQQQTLTIVGNSPTEGGLVLQRAGLAK